MVSCFISSVSKTPTVFISLLFTNFFNYLAIRKSKTFTAKILSLFHNQHRHLVIPNSTLESSLTILTVFNSPSSCFSFLPCSFRESIKWKWFTLPLFFPRLYPALTFLKIIDSGIKHTTNKREDKLSSWKIPRSPFNVYTPVCAMLSWINSIKSFTTLNILRHSIIHEFVEPYYMPSCN